MNVSLKGSGIHSDLAVGVVPMAHLLIFQHLPLNTPLPPPELPSPTVCRNSPNIWRPLFLVMVTLAEHCSLEHVDISGNAQLTSRSIQCFADTLSAQDDARSLTMIIGGKKSMNVLLIDRLWKINSPGTKRQ